MSKHVYVDYHLSTQLYKEFYLHVFMIAKYQNLLGTPGQTLAGNLVRHYLSEM